MKLTLEQATQRVADALSAAGANPAMARSTSRALVLAEAQGLGSHGLSRVLQYITHLRNGRVVGAAVAQVLRRKGATLLVDAAASNPRPLLPTAASLAASSTGLAARSGTTGVYVVLNQFVDQVPSAKAPHVLAIADAATTTVIESSVLSEADRVAEAARTGSEGDRQQNERKRDQESGDHEQHPVEILQ